MANEVKIITFLEYAIALLVKSKIKALFSLNVPDRMKTCF